MLNFYMLMI